jgi:ligand-binding SRPBCC domain-containing protein
MKYRHTFTVSAPLAAVSAFHRRPENMGSLTPPPVIVRVHRAPQEISEGDEVEFTLWFGPLPVRWLARFDQVSDRSFIDSLASGPFRRWDHRHTFKPVGERCTQVSDEIVLALRHHPFWAVFGLAMRLSLPLLFFYRQWRTRKHLEGGS